MSGTELLVIVLGLFIGYWVVSQFGSGGKAHKPPPDQRQADAFAAVPWHEVLNVSPDADVQEIQQAYKRLMSQYHPDKVATMGPELRELCERKSKEINSAHAQAMAERGSV